MNISASGRRIILRSGSYEAHIVTVGAGIAHLVHEGHGLIYSHDDDGFAPAYMGKTLIPWPNRIAGGVYKVDGQQHRLPVNDAEHHAALHGFMAWVEWTVVAEEQTFVELESLVAARPGYPWTLRARVRYELNKVSGLHYVLWVENVGRGTAPYGCASHPYVSFDGASVDGYEIVLPAGSALDVDADLTPVGLRGVNELGVDFTKARVLGTDSLDHAFTDLSEGAWKLRVTDTGCGRAVVLTSDARWVQLYSGEEIGRQGLAIEPMTCAPNAFNNGLGLIWLAPGEEHTFSYSVAAVQA
ncbi:MAG: aldose-1-epimerase [Ancrocorticia sp.]